jgi:hypothetical protein
MERTPSSLPSTAGIEGRHAQRLTTGARPERLELIALGGGSLDQSVEVHVRKSGQVREVA